jgi:putative nucleotidyltransferase with HDIG domain
VKVGLSIMNEALPPTPLGLRNSGPAPLRPAPSDEACFAWWEEYAMPGHIRRHSLEVARVATLLAERALEIGAQGVRIDAGGIRAAALLHDLAKDHAIRFGGNHAQLGAAMTLALTGNPPVAHGVLHHVHWPWEIDLSASFLALAVLYSDKRVLHDRVVSLAERHEDLIERYGKTEYIRGRIEQTARKVVVIEAVLSRFLKVDLHAGTFDCGRLVE